MGSFRRCEVSSDVGEKASAEWCWDERRSGLYAGESWMHMYVVIWYLDNWCMGKGVRCLRQCPLLAKRIVVSPSSQPAVCLPSRMQQPTWLASVLRAESKPHSHHRLATRHHPRPAEFPCNQSRHVQLQHTVRSRTDASSWGARRERQRALPYRRA